MTGCLQMLIQRVRRKCFPINQGVSPGPQRTFLRPTNVSIQDVPVQNVFVVQQVFGAAGFTKTLSIEQNIPRPDMYNSGPVVLIPVIVV